MNHLKGETSPYLLQHVNNPVDWYPYTMKALDKARAENKLIFLSIGYSACHWCHVMAHESFENVQIAELLNKNYISIKVDREERPDLDQIYQTMGQLWGKQGGWPLSVFLTPQRNPLFIGTYFPSSAKFGITSFPELITTLVARYQENVEKFETTGQAILQATQKALSGKFSIDAHQNPIFRLENDEKSPQFMENILQDLSANFDSVHGGFGNAPKFPNFSILVFALRQLAESYPDLSPSMQDLAEKVKFTLNRMANGGIYDQVGGGFHRYTVDAQWLTPHFEKMLYNNAMALLAYTEGYLYFGNPLYKKKVAEILQWTIREMYLPEKGFYSSLDADSEGREGQYYVWTHEAMEQLLPVNDLALVMQAFGMTKKGNFEKKGNILQRVQTNEELATTFSLDETVVSQKMQAASELLLKARENRTPPHLDEKILLSWNALMLHGMFHAYKLFQNEPLGEIIHPIMLKTAQFTRETFMDEKSSQVFRVYSAEQNQVKIPGMLDDYAYLLQALLDEYDLTYDDTLIPVIDHLCKYVIKHFYDSETHQFFYSDDTSMVLPVRPQKVYDMPLPSPTAVMAKNLLRYHYFFGGNTGLEIADRLIRQLAPKIQQSTLGSATALIALQYLIYGTTEISIIHPQSQTQSPLQNQNQGKESLSSLLPQLKNYYIPRLHIYEGPCCPKDAQKKVMLGETTFYYCKSFQCAPPTNDFEEFQKFLSTKFIKRGL